MSKKLGARLGFAVTAFALAVSIVAFLTLDKSLAWFSRNDSVTARGISLSVNAPGVTSSLYSLGVLNIENGVYTFDTATDIETGARIQSSTLPEDDPNGISYSEYRKALVLELTLTVVSDRPTKVHLMTKNTATDQATNVAQENLFSNCIAVSNVASFTANTVTKGGTTQSFVSVQDDTLSKTGSLLLYDGTLTATQPNKLYFIIEYNDAFLDYINYYILNTAGVKYQQVFYYHDVTLEIS